MAPALPRPTRATRGKRLSKLLDEEIEADEEFWNQDAFKEDVADDEYEEEQELADEFDSDFNDDEDESGDEEVEEKERRPKKKQILPPGGKKPLKKGPSGSTKKKGVSFLEEAAAAADAGETPLPTLKTPRQATRPSPEKEDGETEEGEKLLRKSTRTSVIVRQAEREAQRAIQQALPKIVKKKREGEDRKMTQEEMLLEAAQTEIQNRQSLETLLAREEEVKRKAIINKEVYSGPLIRFYSKEGINVLEFVKMPEVPEVINAKAPPCTFTFRNPKQPVCVVTGLLAKYRDPKSGFPYATKEAFAIIRERQRKGEDISRKDSLEKVQRKRTKVEREKFAPGTRTGAVKIKYKKPDKPVETKFQNSPKPQSQPSVENRASGGAGPSGATSSGLGTLDKPENSNKVGEFEDKLDHTSTPAPAPAPLPTPMVEANEADFMLEDLGVSLPSNFDSGLSVETSGMGSGGGVAGQGGGQELQLDHELLNLSPTGPGLPRFSERYDLSIDGQSNNLLLDDSWLQDTFVSSPILVGFFNTNPKNWIIPCPPRE
ncbi:SWR1 complex subunit 2 isoform X3 [Physcomitrium patens]|uniref:SWR1 complex subunit 2 isoform X3 n=1 Tax=Physcomitrium patens TaxID=3218 RepID=UPI000D17DD4F|nr:SWR1 complex subunit 2-like isoform X3 [Physcomitrium patens]|eukprot:XP_024394409.1 SWR1 complex subunit 2-like isoform X3 [Physcomitrella patens]